ncbi:MAG TPA: hypothetical protein PK640_11465 [Verrucomicrobiota bacterium]|nr:hypothetical protein [Verrucomicrobiota bacterium]
MKSQFRFLSALILVCAFFCITLNAADPVEGVVTKVGAASPGATNSVVIFGSSDSGLAIKLTSIQAVGDNADATLALYGGAARTTLSAGQTSTNLTVVSTNLSIAAGDVIVLVDSSGNLGWGFVHSTGTSTINLDRDPGTFSSGSVVWAMTSKAEHTVGNATSTRDGYALFGVKKRSPLLARLYTAAGTTEAIKGATVEYFKPN